MECETRFADGGDLPKDAKPILNAVALADTAVAYPTSVEDPGEPRFAKVGIRVRANTAAALTIPASAHARMHWGNQNPAPHGRIVDIRACPARDVGPWLGYPGAFDVDQPVCAPLTVTVGDRSTTVMIPIGRTCPTR